MKIVDERKETVLFGDIEVTGLFESCEGRVYMKIRPVIVAESRDNDDTVYNAVNVETGCYNRLDDEDEVVPVYGSFHREGGIND